MHCRTQRKPVRRLVAKKERVHLSRKKDWPASIVPFAYCAIKTKSRPVCAAARADLTGPSCARKIISWWHHPTRPKFRAAGRAAAAWVECLRVSCECSSMKTSCADLSRSWSRACKSAGGGHCRSHCGHCGPKLSLPHGVCGGRRTVLYGSAGIRHHEHAQAPIPALRTEKVRSVLRLETTTSLPELQTSRHA